MTKDHDFKTLIRARMAKTGESYATARHFLMQERGDRSEELPQNHVYGATSRVTQLAGQLTTQVGALLELGIELDESELHVWLGMPPTFELSAPRRAVLGATRLPDRRFGAKLGARGRGGRWQALSAYTGLVCITFNPSVAASFQPNHAFESLSTPVPAAAKWVAAPLLRDRQPKVSQLTVSVDDTDALIAELAR